MTIRAIPIPDANSEGFVPLRLLRRAALQQTLDEFVKTYPVPALHVADVKVGASAGNPEATVQEGPQLMTLLRQGQAAFRYLDEVGFLVKRPGNPFPNFVSVGRAPNNDVVLSVETVSKVHAYFTVEAGEWLLTDYRSTNGTKVNDKPMEPESPLKLRDGDRILFGTEVTAVFLSPEALYVRARR